MLLRVASWLPKRRWPAAALFALVASAIGVGAWTGYPVWSDAIVPLIAHDTGAGSLAAKTADRPLYGWMLQATVVSFGFHRLAWIVIGLAAWGFLGWVTARLYRRVFPEASEWSWLPALLVLSPIVVQTQFVTLTIAYPDVVPVGLVVAGLLAGAGRGARRRRGAVAALVLAGLASVISEYGWATAFAGAALALGLRERRTALWLGAGAACGALVFRLTADLSNRPDVTADEQLPKLAAAPIAALYRWLSGVWHATIGAYGGAIWHTQLDPKSRASLGIAALGVSGAVLAVLAAPRAAGADAAGVSSLSPRRFLFLLLAVAAAVLPVAAAGRPTVFPAAWTGEYETRFLLPALPFASLFVAGVIACGMTRPMRTAAAALLGFLCVEASWQGARQAMHGEKWAEQLGRALLPVVRSSDGIVVAVGDDDPRLRWGSILTGKLTAPWRDEDALRVWAMARSRAVRVVGERSACRTPDTIQLDEETRWARRSGRLSSMLWVPPAGDRVGTFEPYCMTPRSP
jgi:hypothetical protein